ncbi:AzlC family ABC transporter permease [Siccirubricoccus sp. G192]|uniref:AzlC family ABC transporter permease n=1 Tax=Siccirubricoccus sp. G192 TaxID=2849651 RepID=UPI001C2C4183|nr:AzlC family ABC transporter permease [Siccirubricoccus sp. G192]MBV1796015.1 AzlC family ABC transporter permease [Siccirubricoccus sp. G192]
MSPPAPPPFLTALRPGAAVAFGAPAIAMGATFLAFGAAVREAGLGLGWALGASLLVYGMAGQLVLLAFAAPGVAAGGIAPAVLGATAANARFLPMAVALAPWLDGRPEGWRRWLALPFIAITPWAAAMRVLPALAPPARLPWFLGFALVSWGGAGLATVAGHLLAPLLDRGLLAALLFANPLYFALLLAAELRAVAPRRAILAGILAAPLALLLPPAWGLLATGVLGGTAAFLIGQMGARQRGRG